MKSVDTLCDIGSGWGDALIYLNLFLPKNTIYYAEDIDIKFCNKQFFKASIKSFNSDANIDNFRFNIGTSTSIPFKHNSFNTVSIFNTIHELSEPDIMFSNIKRIMRTLQNFIFLNSCWS